MLETQGLLLRPAAEAGGVAIVDAATGRPVGCARPPAAARPWGGRFFAPVLEIYELVDDASLVCTLRRTWFLTPAWTVFAADDKRVGHLLTLPTRALQFRVVAGVSNLQGTLMEDRPGGRFATRAGLEVGTLTPMPEGRVLRFAGPAAGDPFVKMTLLAAALLRG